MKIIGTKWVFRNKLDENGIVSQNKARLVAQGYNQQEGIDYDETYAPVARLRSIRILLAYACALDFKLFQMDVKSAFLDGFINEEVYVAQLPRFVDFKKSNHVYKLKKDLYGLKQAPKASLNKLGEAIHKAIQSHSTECRDKIQAEKQEYIDLIDTSKNVTESLEVIVLAKSSSQPKSTYQAAAPLSEFELTKILMDKMDEHKSYLRADYKKELYDALVKSSRDDKDKDPDPSAGSDRGTKRRKSSKETESSIDPKSKEYKSSSSSKGTSRSQHKSSGKSTHFDTGNNDEQPDDEAASKNDWFKKPERPLTLNLDWNKRQHVDFIPPQTWISDIAHAKKSRTSFDELIDTPIDFSTFFLNRLNITNLTQELLDGPSFYLLKGTCKSRTELEYHFEECRQVIPLEYFSNNDLVYLKGGDLSRKYSTSVTKIKAATYELPWIEDIVPTLWSPVKVVYDKHAYWGTSHWVTSLKIMKLYDYSHLDEIKVRKEDQQLYKVKEGDFPRLLLQDIEDMLLLLIQQKLTNLTIDERVKSYQKKLNLSKPDTFRPDLRKRTAYTTYSDPQGVIYVDKNNINRLMRTEELHKFSDGTLNSVRTALHDIASGIMMEYLPKRK
ncbi:retrovirus-related pol polyprotein from transposon TNT 1-94 [Tanacetum coccineum]